MHEIATSVPDVDVLLSLEPEELGAKLLFVLRRREINKPRQTFHFSTLLHELWQGTDSRNRQTAYPQDRRSEVDLALSEAWSWLVAQGLLVYAPADIGSESAKVLSNRARKFQDESELTNFTVARRLPKEALNPRIAQLVWAAFMRGEFDGAVFQAMKAIEVAMRDASSLLIDLNGVTLMRKAFDAKSGALTDMATGMAEREARAHLFAGAFGCYRNPHAHQDVHLDDPEEAIEIIMLANHLLRIVDVRKSAKP